MIELVGSGQSNSVSETELNQIKYQSSDILKSITKYLYGGIMCSSVQI